MERVERQDGSWAIALAGESLSADAVLMAMPAPAAAKLVGDLDPELSRRLRELHYGSTATVFAAYRQTEVARSLDGVGFLVPRSMGRPILAGTWVSSKWPGRAPEGHVLMRAFFGGAAGEEVLARSDDELSQLGCRELEAVMGFRGVPLFTRVYRFHEATAQMRVGHLARVRALGERLASVAPDLRIAGGGYDGVGIPDCVRQGMAAGRAMVG